ncbi:hypothetical protein HY633_00600 [Candidatus Uhrbacteria bacterium]|nr:hypothetical protein [Candidatus Uhrbacteria bacterium]
MKSLAHKFRQPRFIAAAAVIALAGFFAVSGKAAPAGRIHDRPPEIDFTWTPEPPTMLEDIHGRLVMDDDYGLDFSTYRFRVIDIDKTVDLPIAGMIGKRYEQDVYLGLLRDNPVMAKLESVALEFSIADDAGQVTRLVKVIPLKK